MYLTDIRLDSNKIGPYGAAAISSAFLTNKSVKRLAMRLCVIGEAGAHSFAKDVIRSETCVLENVDLSLNSMGHPGVLACRESLKDREKRSLSPMVIDVEGNHILLEVMNAVTHGAGIILCIIGTFMLTDKAASYSPTAQYSCNLYSMSLLSLYTSSTLYHSFFALKTTKAVFSVLDHSAIYILIAGTYTPCLAIAFNNKPIWGTYMLAFLWLCCFLGIVIEAFFPKAGWKKKLSLFLYLAMGWCIVVAMPDLVERVPSSALNLLFVGGLAYTGGVPFFVRDSNLDHSIWHCFVMLGSACHWLCIYWYVLDLDGKFV